jgi:ribonuclease D
VNRPQLITKQQEWEQIAARLAHETELAIDTEANSMYAYRGRICLIQIGSADSAYLLDPLAVTDLSALGAILNDPSVTKILHGSDYDLRSFYREYGFKVSGLFDTETCARFLGMLSPNLADVLRNFLGVEIPKSRRLQRSNWALRPLPPEAVAYAAADVQHLIPLADKLRQLLAEAGRLDWVKEEFSRLQEAGAIPHEGTEPAFFRVKGSDRLSPRELAVLKELFEFRELEAERLDWPAYRVMRNETLLYLTQTPHVPLEEVPDLSPQLVRRAGSKIREAVKRGQGGPVVNRPARTRRNHFLSRDVQARLQVLKQWRLNKSAELGLDPALLWPAASLERLAQQPNTWKTELAGTEAVEIRAWQREQFSRELAEIVDGAARKHPPTNSNG